jgi:hypothetical protein
VASCSLFTKRLVVAVSVGVIAGVGTEAEIEAAMRAIDAERQQRRQSLRADLEAQRRASAAPSAGERAGARSAAEALEPASGLLRAHFRAQSSTARLFGAIAGSGGQSGSGGTSGSGGNLAAQASGFSVSARTSPSVAVPVEASSPLPLAAVNAWAEAVRSAVDKKAGEGVGASEGCA